MACQYYYHHYVLVWFRVLFPLCCVVLCCVIFVLCFIVFTVLSIVDSCFNEFQCISYFLCFCFYCLFCMFMCNFECSILLAFIALHFYLFIIYFVILCKVPRRAH